MENKEKTKHNPPRLCWLKYALSGPAKNYHGGCRLCLTTGAKRCNGCSANTWEGYYAGKA